MVDPHHPYHPSYHFYRRPWHYGRPRFFGRFFWFALGGVATAYYLNKKEEHRRMVTSTAGRFDHNWSPSDPNAGPQQQQHSNSSCGNGWFASWGCKRREMNDRWNQMQAPDRIPQTSQPYEGKTQAAKGWNGMDNSVPAPAAPTVDVQSTTHGRNREIHVDVKVAPSEKFREVGRQAGDAMADISEQALDTLIGSIVALKTKLAEARQEREKLYLEQRMEGEPEHGRRREMTREERRDSRLNVRREDGDDRKLV